MRESEAVGGSAAPGRPADRAARFRSALAVIGWLAVAAAGFGTAERWLSLQHSSFLAAVGGMTAPWLLLPFAVGAARPRRERNGRLGIAAVWLAILAYSAGAATGIDFTGRLISYLPALVPAAVGGPVYAALGHRWRVSRSWLPALAVTAPVMLEPAVRWLVGQSLLFWVVYPPVAYAETATGLALTVAAVVISVRGGSARVWPGRTRRTGRQHPVGRLVRRGAAVTATAAVAGATVVFCAPQIFPQVYPAGNGTVGVVVSPDGRTAYVENYPYTPHGLFPSTPPTLTPVDLRTMRAGRPLEVAPNGWSIVYGLLSPDGGVFYAVVNNDYGSWVSRLDLRTGTRTRIDVPGGADTIALSPGGQTLYVSNYEGAIVPVATATGQTGHAIPLPSGGGQNRSADQLAVTPDGRTIYVSIGGESSTVVTGIDVATGRALPWTYQTVGTLGSLLLASHGRTLYLSILGGSCYEYFPSGNCSVIALNPETGRQVGEPLSLNDSPKGMAATPDGRSLFIIVHDSVIAARLAPDGAPSRPVNIPEWAQQNTGFALSPDGSTLYVSVADGGDPGGLSFIRL
jgi:DNA-binding beta-propeller fold protein YncE